jgi:hypothetical protein
MGQQDARIINDNNMLIKFIFRAHPESIRPFPFEADIV